MLHSPNIPDVPTQISSERMNDLFANFTLNWNTLWPALAVLFGTLFAFFLLKKLKDNFVD